MNSARASGLSLGAGSWGVSNVSSPIFPTFFVRSTSAAIDFLKTTKPPADAVVDYGARDEHCWSGDHSTFNGVSRLTYVERLVPQLVKHWLATAPKGADVTSWRY